MRILMTGAPARRSMLACAAVLLFTGMSASATNHLISFGGSVGFAYSPATMSVAVGDTVTWSGDFSTHPLNSSTIPAGAAAWQFTSGAKFSYVVTVAGAYTYYCTVHGAPDGSGMAGSFTAASVTGIAEIPSPVPAAFRLEQNYPNPFNPATTIRYSIPQREQVTVRVFDVQGKVVATLVNGEQGEGDHQVTFDGSKLSSGVYLYRIQAGGLIATKKLLVVR